MALVRVTVQAVFEVDDPSDPGTKEAIKDEENYEVMFDGDAGAVTKVGPIKVVKEKKEEK